MKIYKSSIFTSVVVLVMCVALHSTSFAQSAPGQYYQGPNGSKTYSYTPSGSYPLPGSNNGGIPITFAPGQGGTVYTTAGTPSPDGGYILNGVYYPPDMTSHNLAWLDALANQQANGAGRGPGGGPSNAGSPTPWDGVSVQWGDTGHFNVDPATLAAMQSSGRQRGTGWVTSGSFNADGTPAAGNDCPMTSNGPIVCDCHGECIILTQDGPARYVNQADLPNGTVLNAQNMGITPTYLPNGAPNPANPDSQYLPPLPGSSAAGGGTAQPELPPALRGGGQPENTDNIANLPPSAANPYGTGQTTTDPNFHPQF